MPWWTSQLLPGTPWNPLELPGIPWNSREPPWNIKGTIDIERLKAALAVALDHAPIFGGALHYHPVACINYPLCLPMISLGQAMDNVHIHVVDICPGAIANGARWSHWWNHGSTELRPV